MPKKVTKAIVFGVLGLLLLGLGLIFYVGDPSEVEYQVLPVELPFHYNGKQFAGSESCIPCHESIYRTHLITAHAHTSALANDSTLLGSFGGEDDKVELTGSRVKMVKEGEDHYQRTVRQGRANPLDESKISVVIGSGVKGQSHLTWQQDSLYQVQASYFTATEEWINSPGFPNYPFKRPITDECIKCHVTFARNNNFTGKTNTYDKSSFIYGISCERCHGPLQGHVDHHTNDPKDTVANSVLRIDTLNRQLQLDVCAQCHSGLRAQQVKENPFSYVAGERLDNYTKNFYNSRPNANLDVHSNQYGLLKSSACFKNTEVMTCTTCHDPHRSQRGTANYFNAKCATCHANSTEVHQVVFASAPTNANNCIECHMPVFPSETMKVRLDKLGTEESVYVRTHLIGVYVDQLFQKRQY